MSQLALKIRSLVGQRTALQHSVGVCDDFPALRKGLSLQQHLNTFTQEDKPLLGNPQHPELIFDECEQLVVPIAFTNHVAVAVIKLKLKKESKKAFIQYFDPTGADLPDDLLISLSAFFTESCYEVLYHCISEAIKEKGINHVTLTSCKAIDLASGNAGVIENLCASLIEVADEPPVATQVLPPEESIPGHTWLLVWLASGSAMYMGFDILQTTLRPYVLTVMASIPANPILAFMACGAVFCGAWLIVGVLQHLTRNSAVASLKSVAANGLLPASAVETVTPTKAYLNVFDQAKNASQQKNKAPNKEATANVQSLRLN